MRQVSTMSVDGYRDAITDAVRDQAHDLMVEHRQPRFVLCSDAVVLLMPDGWTVAGAPMVAGAPKPVGARTLNPGAQTELWVKVVSSARDVALRAG